MRCARLAENERVRQRQVEAFESSGMTMRQWCADNGVSEGTLRYWRRKLCDGDRLSGGWVEIGALQKGAPDGPCTAIVPAAHGNVAIRIGAFSIEATRDCDIEVLKTALAVAASLC